MLERNKPEKVLKPGSLPTLNMPKKTHQIKVIPRASPKRIVKEKDNSNHKYYKSLEDVKTRIEKLKL